MAGFSDNRPGFKLDDRRFVDLGVHGGPSIDMLSWSRALPTLLIAIVLQHFAALAWAEPATDRPFLCDGRTQETTDIPAVSILPTRTPAER